MGLRVLGAYVQEGKSLVVKRESKHVHLGSSGSDAVDVLGTFIVRPTHTFFAVPRLESVL
jgi:hypothetical protein